MISQSEPDYGVTSAHEAFSSSRKQSSSGLAPRQLDNRPRLTQSASPQEYGSCFDTMSSKFPTFGNNINASITGNTDWSSSDLNLPLLSLFCGPLHQTINSRSSLQYQRQLQVDDDEISREQASQDGSWLYFQKEKSGDIEMPVDRKCMNLLEFPDPWGRIGMILGLQKDCLCFPKENQRPEFIQGENNDQQNEVVFESDLPPSDIPLDESLDDIAPSSLPIAESSEGAEVSPIALFLDRNGGNGCVAGAVENISDMIHGNSGLDEFYLESRPDEILSFSEPGLDANKFFETTGHAIKAAQNVSSCIISDNASGVLEEGSRQFLADDEMNSTLSIIGHDVAISTQSRTVSTPVTIHQNDKRTGLNQFTAVIQRVTVLPEGNLPLDGGDYSTAEAMSHKGSVLVVPELQECDGVYQGPCLFSDEPECWEIEE